MKTDRMCNQESCLIRIAKKKNILQAEGKLHQIDTCICEWRVTKMVYMWVNIKE